MHWGCFVWTPTPPLAGWRTTGPGPVRVCVCSFVRPGRAGRPPGHVLLRLTFPLVAVSVSFARPPPGWGCPFLCPFCFSSFVVPWRPRCLLRSLVSGPGCLGPWRLVFLSSPPCRPVLFCPPPPFFLSSFLLRPRSPWLSLVSGPGCPGPRRCVLFAFLTYRFSALRALLPRSCLLPGRWLLPGGCRLPPPLPRLCLVLFVVAARCLVFFFWGALVVSGFLWFPAPAAAGLGAVCCLFCWPPAARLSVRSRLVCVSRLAVGCSLVVAAPPPLCVSRFSSLPLGAPFFFFSSRCAPPLSPAFSGFGPWVPWASALCVVCVVGLPILRSPRALASFVVFAWPLAVPWWLLPPPPPFVSRSFRRRRSVLCAVCCAVLCVPGCGAAPRCGALCRPVLCCCVLCYFLALLVAPLLVVPRPVVLPVALGPCALRRCVLRCSPALCALCCVCFVVVCWCALLLAAVRANNSTSCSCTARNI